MSPTRFLSRFGSLLIAAAALNVVASSLLVFGLATSGSGLPWVPGVGLVLVFVGVLVGVIILVRRVRPAGAEDRPAPDPSGAWTRLPPLGEPRDESVTRAHTANATLAFLMDDISASDGRAWATMVLDEGIPFDTRDADLLEEFLTTWSNPDGLITRHSAYLWQTRFAER